MMKKLSPSLLERMKKVTDENTEAELKESKLVENASRRRTPPLKSKRPNEINKYEPDQPGIIITKIITAELIQAKQKESKVEESSFRRRTLLLQLKRPEKVTHELIQAEQKESKVEESSFHRRTLFLKSKRLKKVTDKSIEAIRKENMIEIEESASCGRTLRLKFKVKKEKSIKTIKKEEKMSEIESRIFRYRKKSEYLSDVIVCELHEKDDAMVQEIKRAINEAQITPKQVFAAFGWPEGLRRYDRLLKQHTMSMIDFLEWAELLKMDVLVSLVLRGKSSQRKSNTMQTVHS